MHGKMYSAGTAYLVDDEMLKYHSTSQIDGVLPWLAVPVVSHHLEAVMSGAEIDVGPLQNLVKLTSLFSTGVQIFELSGIQDVSIPRQNRNSGSRYS